MNTRIAFISAAIMTFSAKALGLDYSHTNELCILEVGEDVTGICISQDYTGSAYQYDPECLMKKDGIAQSGSVYDPTYLVTGSGEEINISSPFSLPTSAKWCVQNNGRYEANGGTPYAGQSSPLPDCRTLQNN